MVSRCSRPARTTWTRVPAGTSASDDNSSLRACGFARDEGGDDGGAEAVVDVDDGDVGRAGVEHAEQRGDSAEGCAVADAGGHGDDGRGDEAADDAGQRAFHAGADDGDFAALQAFVMREQAMEAGDADVEEALDGRAEKFCGDGGLFGDGKIAGAGAEDGYGAGRSWLGCRLAQCSGAGDSVKLRSGHACGDGLPCRFADAGGEDVRAGGGGAGEDLRRPDRAICLPRR